MPYKLSEDQTCVTGPGYRHCYGPEVGSLPTRKRKARRLLTALRLNVEKNRINVRYPWESTAV